MLNLRRCVVGVVAVLLMSGAALAQTQTATNLKTGTIVINPQFDYAESFSDGLAVVRMGDDYRTGKYGFIDKTGAFVINPQFDVAWKFSEGLARVRIGDRTTGQVWFHQPGGGIRHQSAVRRRGVIQRGTRRRAHR